MSDYCQKADADFLKKYTYNMIKNKTAAPYHEPNSVSDRIALAIVKFMRVFADAFFSGRYGHRAVVLETIAAVPGMVGGALQHLRSLRRMENDDGWINVLLDEAENERMHLLTFVQIAKPSLFERLLVIIAQGVFYNLYFILYIFSSKVAHRIVGYLEEEAIYSYGEYLAEIDAGKCENVPAPGIAIKYWDLPKEARLRDVVVVVREDEAKHRDVNHGFANQLENA
ncbi:alternative oxidase [Methylophilus sp. Leaf414]|uniref:alternative oxidase n=1 Tax=Methylophilus sp. Leaf414 TaxID=1736371 RepID=UPI000B1299AC|nr:alternative oxidase [Methylophilus sp. Leaf414]